MSSSCLPGRFLFVAHGNTVFLDRDSRIAARLSGPDAAGRFSFCGYVFLDRPFRVGESLTIRIHAFQELSRSVFGFGMTSCDPRTLDVDSLPDDADLLFDRPEYWVIDRSNFLDLRPGDELDFRFTEGANGDGEIQCAKNDSRPVSIMFVDKTIPLWPFFELGNIAELKLLDVSSYKSSRKNTADVNVDSGVVISDGYLLPQQSGESGTSNRSPQSQTSRAPTAKILPTVGGRKPPAPPVPPRPQSKKTPPGPTKVPTAIAAVTTKGESSRPGPAKEINSKLANAAAAAVNSNSVVKPANSKTKKVAPPPPSRLPPPPSSSSSSSSRDARSSSTSEECVMCMERSIDCVLYTCGHMCLCFGCAGDLKASANALCPVCRKEIADVIRTFRP